MLELSLALYNPSPSRLEFMSINYSFAFKHTDQPGYYLISSLILHQTTSHHHA